MNDFKVCGKQSSMDSKNPYEGHECLVSLCFSYDQSVVRHLNLERFKVIDCPNDKCDPLLCPYFHSSGDLRRNPFTTFYESIPCPNPQSCIKGSQCPMAHNAFEIEFHPSTYKKTFCESYKKNKVCLLGEFCPHAHSGAELRVLLLHTMPFDHDFLMFKFKTENCPFIEPHDPHVCVYSHGPEDFRREITTKPYSNEFCQFVEQRGERACPNRGHCRGCHNYYELAFHPLNFKRIPCKHANCQKPFCPFVHKEESFQMSELDQLNSFFLYPINRSISIQNVKS